VKTDNPQPAATVTTSAPLRSSRVESEVVVPFLQTAITLLFIALCAGLWLWRPLAGALGTVALLVWAWRMLRSDALMWRLERMTGADMTGDGVVGKPGAITLYNPAVARTKVAHAAAQAQDEHSDQERMLTFVKLCYLKGTSEAAQGIKPNTAARDNYVECRDALLALDLAYWRNPAVHSAGWEMALADAQDALDIVEYHT